MQEEKKEPTPKTDQPKLNPDYVQKSIRTYESDLADVMSKKQTSTASIAIAESKKREELARKSVADGAAELQSAPWKSYGKQIIFGFLGLIFIASGAYGGYYLYEQSALAKPYVTPKAIVAPTLIPYDEQSPLAVNAQMTSGELISKIYSQINKTQTTYGKIFQILLTSTSTPVTASSFMRQTESNMPDVIERSLTDRWMFGFYSEGSGEKTPFIALSTDFFQNVFAGMLAWENTMPNDLSALLNYKQGSAYFNVHGSFIDKVIKNRDVREYVSDDGKVFILYSFIDKGTLIITTTESAFIAAIDHIEKQTYVR